MLTAILCAASCSKGTSSRNIDKLLVYFSDQGLTVRAIKLTEREAAYVEDVRSAAQALTRGAGKASDEVIEKGTYLIDNIKVSLVRYRDQATAREEARRYLERKARQKKRAQERQYEYRGDADCYVSGPFLMIVRHFNASLDQHNVLSAQKMSIDPAAQKKVVEAFFAFEKKKK